MRMPQDIGPIHFVGIGGIGMSGIAEVLCNLGYTVQGSDISENANVKRLRDKGIKVMIGHEAAHLEGAQIVVVSSAIKRDNEEVVAARARLLPVVHRARMLAELMRLKRSIAIGGTHGKTTTTSMVATLLDGGGFCPTVINGGIINAYGTNARLGAGDWMVVEADESDGSFVNLPAEIAVITSIDPEHLDHYGNFDNLRDAFRVFLENIPFYGFAVMCLDHPEVRALAARLDDCRIITYGEAPDADARLRNVRFDSGVMRFDIALRNRVSGADDMLDDLSLPMPGKHNVFNASAAIVVARKLGVDTDKIRASLAEFSGVKRRFTRVGSWNGVDIFDDYAHHPVEIASILQAARLMCQGRVIAVAQPHRYTRLHDLFDDFCHCFNDADIVIIADVHAAGEEPVVGFDRDALVRGLRESGHHHVIALEGREQLPSLIAGLALPGYCVICLGAGSITQWANALPGDLERLTGMTT